MLLHSIIYVTIDNAQQRSINMALINCPECKKEVSDKATKCPHCGFSLKRKRNFIITGVSALVVIIVAAIIFVPILQQRAVQAELDAYYDSINNPPKTEFDEKCDLAFDAVLMELYGFDMSRLDNMDQLLTVNPTAKMEGEGFRIEKIDSKEMGFTVLQDIEKNYEARTYSYSDMWQENFLMGEGNPNIIFCKFDLESDIETAQERFMGDFSNATPERPPIKKTFIDSYPYLIVVLSEDQDLCNTVKDIIVNSSAF